MKKKIFDERPSGVESEPMDSKSDVLTTQTDLACYVSHEQFKKKKNRSESKPQLGAFRETKTRMHSLRFES